MSSNSGTWPEEWEFVNDAKNKLYRCNICWEPLHQPTRAGCQSDVFCFMCIWRVAQTANSNLFPCPNCRAMCDARNLAADVWTQNLMEVDDVRCLLKKEEDANTTWNCGHICPLMNLAAHRSSNCPYVKVVCQHCEQVFYREDLAAHQLICTQERIDCPLCSQSNIRRIHLAQHIALNCPEKEMQCTHCQKVMARKHLRRHLELCPAVVIGCPWARFGCKETFVRSELTAHLRSNCDQHLELVNATISEKLDNLAQKFAGSQQVIEKMQGRLNILEKQVPITLASQAPNDSEKNEDVYEEMSVEEDVDNDLK